MRIKDEKPDKWIADPDFWASCRVIDVNLIVVDPHTEVVGVKDSKDRQNDAFRYIFKLKEKKTFVQGKK